MPDLYSVLGLARSRRARSEEIKAAYWTLAKRSHPDVNTDSREAERHTKEINLAYEILGDPEARAAYDLELGRQRATAQRTFWGGAAIGAATFILAAGAASVMVVWKDPDPQTQPSSNSFSAPLTRSAKNEGAVDMPPVEDRADGTSAPLARSESGAVHNKRVSTTAPDKSVELKKSLSSEFASTSLGEHDRKEASASSVPERPQKAYVSGTSPPERALPSPFPELESVAPARDVKGLQKNAFSAPGDTPTKEVASAPGQRKPVLAPHAETQAKAKHTKVKRLAGSASSGYEVPGCSYYALVGTKVVQRCPGAGSNKPIWYNEDAFEGGYGGGGR